MMKSNKIRIQCLLQNNTIRGYMNKGRALITGLVNADKTNKMFFFHKQTMKT